MHLSHFLKKKQNKTPEINVREFNVTWCETVVPLRRSLLPMQCSGCSPLPRTPPSPLPTGSTGTTAARAGGRRPTAVPALWEWSGLRGRGQCWLMVSFIFFLSSLSQYINKFVFFKDFPTQAPAKFRGLLFEIDLEVFLEQGMRLYNKFG